MSNPNNPSACQPHQSSTAGSKDVTTIGSSYLSWDAQYSAPWQGKYVWYEHPQRETGERKSI